MSEIADVFNLEKPLDEYSPELRSVASAVRAFVKRVVEGDAPDGSIDADGQWRGRGEA